MIANGARRNFFLGQILITLAELRSHTSIHGLDHAKA